MPAIDYKSPGAEISAQYKKYENEMQAIAADYFQKMDYAVQENQPHILAKRENRQENIILDDVVKLISSQKLIGKLHRWIHHGLSSQAMIFNLIGPMEANGKFGPLVDVLKTKGVSLPEGKLSGQFEYENPDIFNERKGQPTSIDFTLFVDSKPVVFMEAKLRESSFGECSLLKRHKCKGYNPAMDFKKCDLHKEGMAYWKLLKHYGILDDSWIRADICPLAGHYQFYREVLFAVEQGGYFILLHDNRNPVFVNKQSGSESGIFASLTSSLPEDIRRQVCALSIQELYRSMAEDNNHMGWIDEFDRKYGMNAFHD